MTNLIGDRIVETSTTQGTGTFNLAGASANFQAFSDVFSTGAKVVYCITQDASWEIGFGTLTTGSPDTLSRDAVLGSSNSGAAVDWGSGTKNVFCGIPVAMLAALSDSLSKSVAGGSDVTLTVAESYTLRQKFTGTLTANINVIEKSEMKRLIVADNGTAGAFTLTVKTASGSGVAVTQGKIALLYCDGTDIVDLSGSLDGLLTDSLARGRVLVGNASGAAAAVDVSAAGKALVGDGSDALATGIVKQGTHVVPLPAAAWTPQTTNGCAALATAESTTNDVLTRSLAFDAAAIEYAQTGFRLPKSVDHSATITGTIEWEEAASATSHDCVWQIEMQAQGDGDTIDSAWGTAVTVTDTGSAGTRRFAAFSAVTPAGTPAQQDRLLIRLSRKATDGADTLDVDAEFVEMQLNLTVNAADDS